MSDKRKKDVHEIAIRNITTDAELQPRAHIDLDVVREYSDAMIEGDEFPPVDVYYDGITYWLADGFHRYKAALKAGMPSIRCRVYQGTKEDALLYSMGANASHGVRRTQEDKRRIVLRMLGHPEWCQWSDAEIARRCRVSPSTVRRYRDNSPGLPGHLVTLRVTGNGNLRDCSNGDTVIKQESVDPPPSYSLPPTPLSSADLKEQYLRRVARALKRTDPKIKTNVETPFGNIDIVGSGGADYYFTTAHDQYTLFAALGKAVFLSCLTQDSDLIDIAPVLVGHISPRLASLAKAIRDVRLAVVVTPEALIAENEATDVKEVSR